MLHGTICNDDFQRNIVTTLFQLWCPKLVSCNITLVMIRFHLPSSCLVAISLDQIFQIQDFEPFIQPQDNLFQSHILDL